MRTTYGDISPRTAAFAVKRLLERGKYDSITELFGQIDPQGENKTKTRKYRRFNSMARATAPLAEGITPAGQKLTATDVTINLEQYGDLTEITDVVIDTHEDPVLMEAEKICSEQIKETVECLRIGYLKAGTTVYYANGVSARGSVDSPPVRGDFRKIVRYFRLHKAQVLSELIAPTAKISTFPVAPAYFCMCSTDLEADLRGISGFVPVEQYSDPSKAVMNEIGKIEGVRILCSPLFEAWAAAGTAGTTYLANGATPSSSTACDVYPMIFVAKDGYAICPLGGKNGVSPVVLNASPDKSDPLGQRGYVAWKRWDGGGILNQDWVIRLEAAATANPS